ncbi:hypothetical protein [Actinomadura mexicana]|uniref:Uncharacterized protein n=1 Tax=Actinomadura mexicana TaxID=134959 RepID=A0A238XFK1_9ACTN|nr:hypothetical protein [Actinomadura mexicana]SNR57388.1 hypothetical protein SAMN06265355_104273 [Actinomadura mexicana]
MTGGKGVAERAFQQWPVGGAIAGLRMAFTRPSVEKRLARKSGRTSATMRAARLRAARNSLFRLDVDRYAHPALYATLVRAPRQGLPRLLDVSASLRDVPQFTGVLNAAVHREAADEILAAQHAAYATGLAR